MSDLVQHVTHSIRSRTLLRQGQRVLVAVSGGVDSMVLLHLLHRLSQKHQWSLTVAHLNHQLRGRSSDADEGLVRRTARQLGLPFVGGKANVRKLAGVQKLSLEMAARLARHNFLARTAVNRRIRTIALAHHADDQVELFFLRLFRGSGGEGLAGMKWFSVSPVNPRLTLIRPLLDVSKAELKKFASGNGITHREDASNRDRDIQRNRIRHELLPLLRRRYQPALDRTLPRVMEIAGGDAEFVHQTAVRWLAGKKSRAFNQLPLAVQRRCILLQLLRRKLPGDYELVERLRMNRDRPVTISSKLTGTLTSQGNFELQATRAIGQKSTRREVRLVAPTGRVDFEDVTISWSIRRRTASTLVKYGVGCEYFDADQVGSKLLVRHWLPGDRFQPIGLPVTVKLQDLFANQKIPRSQRHELLVVTNAAGELVWVEKLRISERFKLSKETKRILQWRWKRF